MNAKAWLTQELHASGRTAYDFFNDCWNAVHPGNPCRSNRIVLDAQKYCRTGDIPNYVSSRFEMLKKANATLPPQAEKMARWDAPWMHQAYRLVSEPGPLLVAHKGRDGVWR